MQRGDPRTKQFNLHKRSSEYHRSSRTHVSIDFFKENLRNLRGKTSEVQNKMVKVIFFEGTISFGNFTKCATEMYCTKLCGL